MKCDFLATWLSVGKSWINIMLFYGYLITFGEDALRKYVFSILLISCSLVSLLCVYFYAVTSLLHV